MLKRIPLRAHFVITLALFAFVFGWWLRLQLVSFPVATANPKARLTSLEEYALQSASTPPSAQAEVSSPISMEMMQLFYSVFKYVERQHVDYTPAQTQPMAYSAVRAMLQSLNDPDTRFLEPAEAKVVEESRLGRYHGIGAVLTVVRKVEQDIERRELTVVTPLVGSPAEKAGLQPGDVITEIDGKWVIAYDPFQQVRRSGARGNELVKALEEARQKIRAGIDLRKSLNMLTSKDQSPITLTVRRANATLKLRVTPGVTEVQPVTYRQMGGGIAYIRIAHFQEQTPQQLRRALESLPRPLKGVVIDLRNNPGGMLEAATKSAEMLVKSSVMAIVETRNGDSPKRQPISLQPNPRVNAPMVVLVNRGTANVSEAFAVALRDRAKARLVGERTFGDALVQSYIPLPDGSAMTLTTGKLLTLNGGDFHGKGVYPAIAAPTSPRQGHDLALEKAVNLLSPRPTTKA